MLNSFLNVNI